MNNEQTTAQKIAKQFNNDGQCFTDKAGNDFTEVCKAERLYVLEQGYHERYEFFDGSTIIICGDGWDFGVDGCKQFCWDGVGCDCEEKEAEEKRKEAELEAWEKQCEEDYTDYSGK